MKLFEYSLRWLCVWGTDLSMLGGSPVEGFAPYAESRVKGSLEKEPVLEQTEIVTAHE